VLLIEVAPVSTGDDLIDLDSGDDSNLDNGDDLNLDFCLVDLCILSQF